MSFYSPLRAPSKDAAAKQPTKNSSLAAQVARKMVFWASFNTLILTAIGYFFVAARAEQQALSYLGDYLNERVRAESQVFRTGERNLRLFRDRFLAAYSNPAVHSSRSFDDVFVPHKDGSIRSRPIFFKGAVGGDGLPQGGSTGFIGKRHDPITADVKRRMMLGFEMVSDLGPAWVGSNANLYAIFPENAVVVHWPGAPWALEIEADYYFPDASIGGATRPSVNPERKPVWSDLYLDRVLKSWMVSHQIPVDYKGRHLAGVGQDLTLDEMVKRLERDHPAGGRNVLLAQNGSLIAGAAEADALSRAGAGANGWAADDMPGGEAKAIFQAINDDIKAAGAGNGSARIAKSDALDAYVGYKALEGPGWWFVTIYPRSLVAASARDAANGLLVIAILSFALMVLVVLSVLRDRVARPIGQMKRASERVSEGDFEAIALGSVPLPEEQNNEIGLLATSFKGMAKKIGDHHRELETTVATRTLELKAANAELERLSLRDSLTGAHNRRAFDRDLRIAAMQAKSQATSLALMMCDIDCFKLYNDTYGHPAGDAALSRVTAEAQRAAPAAQVYRYGGEELALIIRAPSYDECRALASRVVQAIADIGLPHSASPHGRVTISAGLAPITHVPSETETLIQAADAQLYQAKRGGRNRLVAEGQEYEGAVRDCA